MKRLIMPSIRLLCTGDLHLGRYPTRIPPHETSLSVSAAWQRVVDYAITQRVDALALTGDIVDASNRYFESYGTLRSGLERLIAEGISVYAVAGNHDYDVLPRLVETLDNDLFHLLGLGGTWQTAPLLQDGHPAILFAGWSFPSRHFPDSPLESFSCPETDVPIVCLVHGDLDVSDSAYAPLRRADLEGHPVSAWLLGHIHRPARYPHRDGCILYPGSLQPLDPGEEGLHGPWLLEISSNGRVEARHVYLASLCYASLEIDVTGVSEMEQVESHITQEIEEDLRQRCEIAEDIGWVVYRLKLYGRTKLHRELKRQEGRLAEDLVVHRDRARGTIDKVEMATAPDYELERFSEISDPPGMLARLLLQVEKDMTDGDAPGEDHRELFMEAEEALRSVFRARAYAPLRSEDATGHPPDEHVVGQLLLRQGQLLLEEILAQK